MEDTQIEVVELSDRDLDTLNEYFTNGYNKTKAYAATHPGCTYESARTLAAKYFANVRIKGEIERRLEEKHMSLEEATERISSFARGDMGMFYKVVDEWMFNPLSSYEILDEKEVVDDSDPEKPVKRISYRVRHVALDMDKVMDPRYSHLIKEFTDDGRKLSIKLHSAHDAARDILKIRGGQFSRRENAPDAPSGAIVAAPTALLDLMRLMEGEVQNRVDQARAVDAVATDIRNDK